MPASMQGCGGGFLAALLGVPTASRALAIDASPRSRVATCLRIILPGRSLPARISSCAVAQHDNAG